MPNAQAREQILRVQLKDDLLASDVDLSELAAMTDGMSGSDIHAFCQVCALMLSKVLALCDRSLGCPFPSVSFVLAVLGCCHVGDS